MKDVQPGAAARHVLLVEDDAPIGRLVSLVLTGAQYRVTVCLSGETALMTLQEEPVDVLLLDIPVPAVADARLGLLREVGKTPVIVMTDLDDETVLVDCLRAGAFDILLKPFVPEQLETAVGLAAGLDVNGISDLPALTSNVLDIDFASLRAARSGVRQPLSLSEWRFLEALARRLGQTVLYQEILRHVHGPAFRDYPRLGQAWAARLGKKISLAEFHGLGYALVI